MDLEGTTVLVMLAKQGYIYGTLHKFHDLVCSTDEASMPTALTSPNPRPRRVCNACDLHVAKGL
jgi:hypothetical protein